MSRILTTYLIKHEEEWQSKRVLVNVHIEIEIGRGCIMIVASHGLSNMEL